MYVDMVDVETSFGLWVASQDQHYTYVAKE